MSKLFSSSAVLGEERKLSPIYNLYAFWKHNFATMILSIVKVKVLFLISSATSALTFWALVAMRRTYMYMTRCQIWCKIELHRDPISISVYEPTLIQFGSDILKIVAVWIFWTAHNFANGSHFVALTHSPKQSQTFVVPTFPFRCFAERSLLHLVLGTTYFTRQNTWGEVALRRGVRSDAQLSCTETRFQKCC